MKDSETASVADSDSLAEEAFETPEEQGALTVLHGNHTAKVSPLCMNAALASRQMRAPTCWPALPKRCLARAYKANH